MTDYTNIVSHLSDEILLEGSQYEYPQDRMVLLIDEDGPTIHVEEHYSHSDGVPMAIWHGRVRRIELARNGCVIVNWLRRDLKDGGKLSTLIDRVKNGLSVEWDGNNYKGGLTEDAVDAEDEIGRLNYIDESIEIWDEEEWLAEAALTEIEADWTDDDVREWLKEMRTCQSEVRLVNGGQDWALEVRNDKQVADLIRRQNQGEE